VHYIIQVRIQAVCSYDEGCVKICMMMIIIIIIIWYCKYNFNKSEDRKISYVFKPKRIVMH